MILYILLFSFIVILHLSFIVTGTSCVAGQYAASDGASSCLECEKGKHASAGAATTCSYCAAGQETNTKEAVGGSSCIDCIGGHFEDVHLCTVCPIGWNQITTKQSACVECVVGRKAPTEKTAIACTVCHNGECKFIFFNFLSKRYYSRKRCQILKSNDFHT